MADTSQLSEMRTYLEQITHTADDSNFAGSTYELQLLNKAYQKTAYKYDWPQTLKRWADIVIANVDRYSLQSDFRKFTFLYLQGFKHDKTTMEYMVNTFERYAIANDSSEYLVSQLPTTASTPFTISGSVVAGSAVIVTLNTVSGISAGDEVFISDTTSSEFTKVQSVDATGITITVKLANNHSSSVVLYRTAECVYFQYQKKVTNLSSASDVPILPGDTHLSIPHYSAYLYYKDIEEPDRASMHLDTWTNEIDEAWLAFDKTATGDSGEFTI